MSVLTARLLLASVLVCALAVIVGKIRNNTVIVAELHSSTAGPLSLFFIDLEGRWGFERLKVGRDEAWSSEGQYVVYSEKSYLNLLNIFTHERKQVETEVNCLSWSPDNMKLFCQSRPSLSSWVVDRETLLLHEVFPNYRISQFEWVPDSKGGIFTVRNDDVTTIYIAPTFADPPRPFFSHQGRFGIQLSPDGRYLVASNPSSSDSNFAFLIDVNDASVRSLNDDFSVPNREISRIVWSPEGSRLVFQAVTLRGGRREPLYVLDVSTGDMNLLAEDGYAPRWSPNGRYLTFIRNDEEDFGFYSNFTNKFFTANADGSEVVQIADSTLVGSVWWLDDSEHLLGFGEGRFYRLSRTGGEPATFFFTTDERAIAYVNEVNLWE
jgi:dipeptidyl aminopeptidase/acylaminoacyl peptidase